MLDKNKIPQHVAIIMDGNGRWAKERNLPRAAGHKAGIERIKEVLQAASDLGIKFLTLFTFSTENWSRPKQEVSMLMRSLHNFLSRQAQELDKNNIRFKVIGRERPLPGYLFTKIKEVEERTKNNQGLTVVLALNYGGRQEIVDGLKKFANAVFKNNIQPEQINEEKFQECLYTYTAGLPDPDLLIRTSGEMRLSNFLLWQASYTELYFLKKYWPDFGRKDLERAIAEYNRRERRFGAIDAGKKDN